MPTMAASCVDELAIYARPKRAGSTRSRRGSQSGMNMRAQARLTHHDRRTATAVVVRETAAGDDFELTDTRRTTG